MQSICNLTANNQNIGYRYQQIRSNLQIDWCHSATDQCWCIGVSSFNSWDLRCGHTEKVLDWTIPWAAILVQIKMYGKGIDLYMVKSFQLIGVGSFSADLGPHSPNSGICQQQPASMLNDEGEFTQHKLHFLKFGLECKGTFLLIVNIYLFYWFCLNKKEALCCHCVTYNDMVSFHMFRVHTHSLCM